MKTGRGREYNLPLDTERFGPYAEQAAYMDEMAARCLDLVADLPAAVADAVPEGGTNSIHMLCVHMYWAERYWLARTISGETLETDDIGQFVLPADWRQRPWSAIAETLTHERDGTVNAAIEALASGDASFTPTGQFATVEPLLEHLKWHWVYHGGQVGLLRRLLGERYKWTFA